MNQKDITGNRYGKLVAIKYIGSNPRIKEKKDNETV